MNTLVPLFAIGVFVGFTLSQAGMVRHWWHLRPAGWRFKLALNGFGAILTGVAAVVVTATKFTDGAWLIAVALPALVLLMEAVQPELPADRRPARAGPDPGPARGPPVAGRRTGARRQQADPGGALGRQSGLGHDVVAVHAVNTGDPDDVTAFTRLLDDWQRWQSRRTPGRPVRRPPPADRPDRQVRPAHCEIETVFVLIPEVEPEHLWQRLLQNHRGAMLAHALRRDTDAVVCRLRFRIPDNEPTPEPTPTLVTISHGD